VYHWHCWELIQSQDGKIDTKYQIDIQMEMQKIGTRQGRQ